MTRRQRFALVAAIGFPVMTITVYLLWIWPQPRTTSVIADTAPYLLSLLTGLPFVWKLTGGLPRGLLVVVFLTGGFVVLWVYALAILCGVRGVCL